MRVVLVRVCCIGVMPAFLFRLFTGSESGEVAGFSLWIWFPRVTWSLATVCLRGVTRASCPCDLKILERRLVGFVGQKDMDPLDRLSPRESFFNKTYFVVYSPHHSGDKCIYFGDTVSWACYCNGFSLPHYFQIVPSLLIVCCKPVKEGGISCLFGLLEHPGVSTR